MARKKRNSNVVALAEKIASNYQLYSVEDIEDVLKDIFDHWLELA